MPELIAFDIDGVLTEGVRPEPGAIIISGRTFAEYDTTCRVLAQHFPVYVRGSGAYGDHQAAGLFKAVMIALLGVTEFHEDLTEQVKIIRQHCPVVKIVVHGRAALSNSPQI